MTMTVMISDLIIWCSFHREVLGWVFGLLLLFIVFGGLNFVSNQVEEDEHGDCR